MALDTRPRQYYGFFLVSSSIQIPFGSFTNASFQPNGGANLLGSNQDLHPPTFEQRDRRRHVLAPERKMIEFFPIGVGRAESASRPVPIQLEQLEKNRDFSG